MKLTGVITDVRPQGPRKTKAGHDVNAYYLTIASTPPIADGYLQAKTYEPKVGEEITVDVDNPAEKGTYLKRDTGYDGSRDGGGKRDNEGQIIGWAHTLAAFELAHNLTHADVASRASQILAARNAPDAATAPITPDEAQAATQPPADDAEALAF